MADQVKMDVNEVDDSQIQNSILLKIFSSNDSQMLDGVIGELDQKSSLLVKKLTTILVGKKRGFLKEKATRIVTDPKFIGGILDGNIDFDRLKVMLKFEMDDRVDNSIDSKIDFEYVTMEEIKELGNKIEDEMIRVNNELYEEQKKNRKFLETIEMNKKELSHYENKLSVSERFLGLKINKELALDLNGIMYKISDELGEYLRHANFNKFFDLLDDIQFVLYLIESAVDDQLVKIQIVNIVQGIFDRFYINPELTKIIELITMNEYCDPFIRNAPLKIESISNKLKELKKWIYR